MQIRPVSDLRNKFPEIEELVEAMDYSSSLNNPNAAVRLFKELEGQLKLLILPPKYFFHKYIMTF